MAGHRPCLGEMAPGGRRRFSQARTMRGSAGSTSLLGRNPAVGARNRPLFCATSRLGRNSLLLAGEGRGVSAGRRGGPSPRLSQGGILRAPISPKRGRCVRNRSYFWLKGRCFSQAGALRACLGTSSLLGRDGPCRGLALLPSEDNVRQRAAHRPALGECAPSGRCTSPQPRQRSSRSRAALLAAP